MVSATLELIRVHKDKEASVGDRYEAKRAAIQAKYKRIRHNGRKIRLSPEEMPPGYSYCRDCNTLIFRLPKDRVTHGPRPQRCDDCMALLTL